MSTIASRDSSLPTFDAFFDPEHGGDIFLQNID
jgi:hypothetical protein